MIGVLFTSLLELVGIGAVVPIVYSLSDNTFFDNYEIFSFIKKYYSFETSLDSLIFFLSIFCLIFFIKNTYLIIFHYFEGKFIFTYVRDISYKLYKNYLRNPYSKSIEKNSSSVITKLSSELIMVQNYLISFLLMSSELIIFSFIITFIIFFYSSNILFIIIFFGILISIFFFIFYPKIKSYGENRKKLELQRISKINDTVGGLKDIKILNLENIFIRNYLNLASKISISFVNYFAIQKIPRLYLELSIIICLSLLTFYMHSQNVNTNEIFVFLAINFAIFLRLLPSLNKIMNSFNSYRWTKKSATEIISLANQKILEKKFFGNIHFKNSIVFKKLTFSYSKKSKSIIQNLNLKIKKGEKIAIMGNSGIGKSTFVNLLCGLLTPSNGSIKIDEKTIVNKDISKLISYAPQSPYLFDDTLYYNITLDDQFTTKNFNKFMKILAICDLLNFNKINLKKNKKYKLGDKGVKISGGQKQRVGLARALFHLKEILVLDEPTSSLEISLENKIIKNILANYLDKTIITITHKKNVSKIFDKMYIFKNKKLILS
jgi:ABC-type bacteriocin/lantibiotic exporter with double-glycine peptidase domain